MAQTDFYTALRTAIRTAWPEVLPPPASNGGGIWLMGELDDIPFEKFAAASPAKMPVVIIDADLRSTPQQGMCNRVDAGPVMVHYLVHAGATGGNLESVLISKLETLRSQLMSTTLATGFVKGHPSVHYGNEVPLNEYLERTNQPYVCGAVVALCVTGDTP